MTKRDDNFQYPKVIDEICNLNWENLTSDEMVSAAWAYYYFSIQFRENLEIARGLYPFDEKLAALEAEECNTDNLSPWPDVAAPDEKMNHDEYMRRTLALLPIVSERSQRLVSLGETYLAETRNLQNDARAASIASYENGGLESVFRAMLTFRRWDNVLLRSFEHFLAEHIRFDSDPDQGHGALSRHIKVDDSVLPLWDAFRRIMVSAVPTLNPAGR